MTSQPARSWIDPSGQSSSTHPDAEGLRTAFDLHEAGVDLERQRLRREQPNLDSRQIEALLRAWLHREGEPGDAAGSVRERQGFGR